jgi:hypothetical protein
MSGRVLSEPITCPCCHTRWTIETSVSWWRHYDRCWRCIAHTAGCAPTDDTHGRVPTPAEAAPFAVGQLDLFGGAA